MLSGIEELRQFKIFAELDEADFESIGRISNVREFDTAERLTAEGDPADQLYLFLKGKAAVKVKPPDRHRRAGPRRDARVGSGGGASRLHRVGLDDQAL